MDRATVPLVTGGYVEIDRHRRSATFHKPARPDRDAVAHPCMAAVGIVFARWSGREALHGGAVLGDGGAWLVLGGKEVGKSTLLAWLATAGHAVVADDLVVTDGQRVFAGPRGVDLRDAAAPRLAEHAPLEVVRDGERHRLLLDEVPPEVPLAGWIVLEPGERMAVEPVAPPDRLGLLASVRMIPGLAGDPVVLLDLAARPGYRLYRPESWDALPEAAAAVASLGRRSP